VSLASLPPAWAVTMLVTGGVSLVTLEAGDLSAEVGVREPVSPTEPADLVGCNNNTTKFL